MVTKQERKQKIKAGLWTAEDEDRYKDDECIRKHELFHSIDNLVSYIPLIVLFIILALAAAISFWWELKIIHHILN